MHFTHSGLGSITRIMQSVYSVHWNWNICMYEKKQHAGPRLLPLYVLFFSSSLVYVFLFLSLSLPCLDCYCVTWCCCCYRMLIHKMLFQFVHVSSTFLLVVYLVLLSLAIWLNLSEPLSVWRIWSWWWSKLFRIMRIHIYIT